MIYGSSITINGNKIYVFNAKAKKLPGTYKQILGKKLIEHQIPIRSVRDWNITYEATIFGDDMDSIRLDLEDKYASVATVALVDGAHDGTYIIRDLDFEDSEQNPTEYRFNIELIEWNQ